jgi:hypothetical protein
VLATLLILNDKREPFISGIDGLCLLERSYPERHGKVNAGLGVETNQKNAGKERFMATALSTRVGSCLHVTLMIGLTC